MKRLLRRSAALLLSAALLIPTVYASYALGDEVYDYTIPLAANASLTTQVLYSNSGADLRTENYITYTPGSSLSPVVGYGGSVLSKMTVASMASSLENQGKRVLSGINGDYFVMATGVPLGILVTDGILRSSDGAFESIGFRADGTAVVGWPSLKISATFLDHSLDVAGLNKVRTDEGGYFLLTSDFASTTQNNQAGVDVVLSPISNNLGDTVTSANGLPVTLEENFKINSRVSCVVEEVLESTGSIPIPEGKFVITINSRSNAWLVEMLTSLTPGDTVDIDITTTDTGWNTVENAIGAYGRLLSGGNVVSGLDAGAAPAPPLASSPTAM